MVLEKTLESPLNCKEIKPVNPKGNKPWIFIGRTDTEAPTLWPPDAKSWLIGKDLDAGKDWGQEAKWATEDEVLDSITNSMDMSLSKLREMVEDREAWWSAVLGAAKNQTWLSNWTTCLINHRRTIKGYWGVRCNKLTTGPKTEETLSTMMEVRPSF